jgi:hypothetical protein
MSPATILLVGLVALLVLIPTRRLQMAGWARQSLTTYYVSVWFLGSVVAALPSPARFLLPILLVAYLAPFITLREGLNRLRGRPPSAPRGPTGGGGRFDGRPPMKDVTPPEERVKAAAEEPGR